MWTDRDDMGLRQGRNDPFIWREGGKLPRCGEAGSTSQKTSQVAKIWIRLFNEREQQQQKPKGVKQPDSWEKMSHIAGNLEK